MDHHKDDLDRLRAVVRAYGSSPDRWPETDRYLVAKLSDDALAAPVAEERALDELLEAYEAPVQTQNLMNAVLTIPTRSSGRKIFTLGLWPFRAAWQPASIAAVALVAGIAAGQVTQVQVQSTISAADVIGVDEDITLAMGEFAMGALYIVTEDQQ